MAAILIGLSIGIGTVMGTAIATVIIKVNAHKSFMRSKKYEGNIKEAISHVNKKYDETKYSLLAITNQQSSVSQTIEDRRKSEDEYRRLERIQKLIHDAKNLIANHETKFNIGIVGQRGLGKSSLVNAIIGEKRAEVGCSEATKELKCYMLDVADDALTVIWDSPGWGTQSFRFDEYYETLKIFDYVLIVVGQSIDERDFKLYKLLQENHVSSSFVRSKADHDVDDYAQDKYENNYLGLNADLQEKVAKLIYDEITKNFETELAKANVPDAKYYYINTREFNAEGDKTKYPTFDKEKFCNDFISGICNTKKKKILQIMSGSFYDYSVKSDELD